MSDNLACYSYSWLDLEPWSAMWIACYSYSRSAMKDGQCGGVSFSEELGSTAMGGGGTDCSTQVLHARREEEWRRARDGAAGQEQRRRCSEAMAAWVGRDAAAAWGDKHFFHPSGHEVNPVRLHLSQWARWSEWTGMVGQIWLGQTKILAEILPFLLLGIDTWFFLGT
jgi:hypothetical protein